MPVTWETLTIIFPYATVVAGVGLSSLLTLSILDEITGTVARTECVAQGAANVLVAVQRDGGMRHDWPEPH